MTREEIFEDLRQRMAKMFELDAEEITLDSSLGEDLDLDSIDAIDLIVKLQEMAGRKVDKDALRKVRTVGDVVALVDAMMRPQP